MNIAGLRATLEGLEAQVEALGAAVEAALSMLPDAEDAEPAPPPSTISPGRLRDCPHERTEQAGGFGGNALQHICVACGATVARR